MKWRLVTAASKTPSGEEIEESALSQVLPVLLEQSPSLFDFDQDVEAVRVSDGLRLSGSQLLAFLAAP